MQSRFPDGSAMRTLAVYLHDKMRFGDRLTVTVGGRASHFDIELPVADGGVDAELSVLTGAVTHDGRAIVESRNSTKVVPRGAELGGRYREDASGIDAPGRNLVVALEARFRAASRDGF